MGGISESNRLYRLPHPRDFYLLNHGGILKGSILNRDDSPEHVLSKTPSVNQVTNWVSNRAAGFVIRTADTNGSTTAKSCSASIGRATSAGRATPC